MFNWAEDNIIRERVSSYLPMRSSDYELHPETLPGAPGSEQRPDRRSSSERSEPLCGGMSVPPALNRNRLADRRCFDFMTMRVLGAIPLLFLLSIVTFAIIQAPPGDYADYHPLHADQPGRRARLHKPRAQAQIYRQAQRPQRPSRRAVFPLDNRHRHPLRFRPFASSITSRSRPGRRRAPACHDRTGADLPSSSRLSWVSVSAFVAATRQYSAGPIPASASSRSSA
jgi:hypothetical protein